MSWVSTKLLEWGPGDRDDEGHRTYRVVHQVEFNDADDGPAMAMSAPGLPLIGAVWGFGNDLDLWAFCTPFMKVAPYVKGEKVDVNIYKVEQRFTTKPLFRCQDETIEDPLLEPDRVSGNFSKYTKEVTMDKDGSAIQTSSHETIKGPQVEFDHNRPSVRIQQTVPNLELETFAPMVDTVNDAVMWGMAARTIKLSNVSWERRLFGICDFYYVRTLEFEIDSNTFDRTALDEGTKVLHGHWEATGWALDNINGSPPDKDNPQHFDRFKDRKGENARTVLDGNGEPYEGAGTGTSTPGEISIKYYPESNFLTLGVPVVLDL